MMENDSQQTLNFIAQILFEKKSCNILALDVRGISTLTDFFIIAEGNVDKHVIALGRSIVDGLKKQGMSPIHTEGLDSGDWVVIDYMEIVIHIFMPGMREKYRLEELWHDGKIIDLDFALSMEQKRANE